MLLVSTADWQSALFSIVFPNPFHRAETNVNREQITSRHVSLQLPHFPPLIESLCCSPVRILSQCRASVEENRDENNLKFNGKPISARKQAQRLWIFTFSQGGLQNCA